LPKTVVAPRTCLHLVKRENSFLCAGILATVKNDSPSKTLGLYQGSVRRSGPERLNPASVRRSPDQGRRAQLRWTSPKACALLFSYEVTTGP